MGRRERYGAEMPIAGQFQESACTFRPACEKSSSTSLLHYIDGTAGLCAGRWVPREDGRQKQLRASLLNHIGFGGQLPRMGEGGAVALGTGATANLVRFRRSVNRNLLLEMHGLPRVSTCPACTRFKFGGDRLREGRFAADISLEFAVCKGTFAASVLDADIPALLRKGAFGSLGGQLESPSDASSLRTQGVDIPLKVNQTGQCILSLVTFGGGRSGSWRGSKFPASYDTESPDISDGGLHVPFTADGTRRF